MTMMANASPLLIPYATTNVGQDIKFIFNDAMADAAMLATPGKIDPRRFTGGYLFWKNDTDFVLYGVYDTSGHNCFLLPGESHFCPLNGEDTYITWTVQGKMPYQVHPLEQLHMQYLDKGDMESGHGKYLASGLVNPSTPAAAIGPGPLPVGVTIPLSQVTQGISPIGNYTFTGRIASSGASGTIAFQDNIASTAVDQVVLDIVDATTGGIHWRLFKQAHASGDALYFRDVTDTLNPLTILPNGAGITALGTATIGQLSSDSATFTSNGSGAVSGVSFTASGALTGGSLSISGNSVLTGTTTATGQIADNSGNDYLRSSTKGGGAAGIIVWEGTTDPTTNAGEGDVWVAK